MLINNIENPFLIFLIVHYKFTKNLLNNKMLICHSSCRSKSVGMRSNKAFSKSSRLYYKSKKSNILFTRLIGQFLSCQQYTFPKDLSYSNENQIFILLST